MYSNLDNDYSQEKNLKLEECKNCKKKVKKGIRLCPECGELNPTLRNHEIWKIMIIILILGAILSFLGIS